MPSNFIQSGPLTYKDLLNQRVEDRFYRTTRRLAVELDILRRRDLDLELSRILSGGPAGIAPAKADDFIAQSVRKILDIRKRLGIETAAGQNSPLDDLLKPSKKGALFDKTS